MAGSIFHPASKANHLALKYLWRVLDEVGFRLIKKIEKERTLRVYPVRLYRYPLLNPRFVRTSRAVRGLRGRTFLAITVLSKGDEVLDNRLRAFPSTADCSYLPIRERRTGLFAHGRFLVPLPPRTQPEDIDYQTLGSRLETLLRHLKKGRLCLANGREVFLSRFGIAPTYAGQLEGSPETVSPHILEELPKQAARVLSPARPLVVVPPSRMPLPGWLCVAELDSRRGARQTDPDYSSRLYVCWFAEDTARSIDEMVEAVLPHLDWEQAAEDYDSTYI